MAYEPDLGVLRMVILDGSRGLTNPRAHALLAVHPWRQGAWFS
jgi:hypothetical protein